MRNQSQAASPGHYQNQNQHQLTFYFKLGSRCMANGLSGWNFMECVLCLP